MGLSALYHRPHVRPGGCSLSAPEDGCYTTTKIYEITTRRSCEMSGYAKRGAKAWKPRPGGDAQKRQRQVLYFLRSGLPSEEACNRAGVSKAAFNKWKEVDADFRRELDTVLRRERRDERAILSDVLHLTRAYCDDDHETVIEFIKTYPKESTLEFALNAAYEAAFWIQTIQAAGGQSLDELFDMRESLIEGGLREWTGEDWKSVTDAS